VVPLVAGPAVLGGLLVGTVREARRWPDELVARLRLLADVFAHTLARQRAERAATERATEIQTLAGRLITAQEAERRRIARELHDGVNQQLTALSIALATLGRRVSSGPVDLPSELARLQGRTAGVVQDIRSLSHELHPGVLEQVGLVDALDGYCEEFEKTHGVGVTFRADPDLGVVPIDLTLCLYRATQEALGNVAKHAKARQVRVRVAREGGDVVLIVDDDGCGFDRAEARRRHGLGLVSLEERVRLVGGQVTIDTGPQRGTAIRIVAPLPTEPDAPSDGPAR
jgi:signal transduction histidine kinase